MSAKDVVKRNGQILYRAVEILVILGGLLFWGGKVDAKVDNNAEQSNRIRREHREDMNRIDGTLDRLDDKTSRIMELLLEKEKDE